eukprot:7723439-Prorocentrum_lima.AAC.1
MTPAGRGNVEKSSGVNRRRPGIDHWAVVELVESLSKPSVDLYEIQGVLKDDVVSFRCDVTT